ncbi:Pilus assembly protein [Vibrio crassostreae]|nr:Pilus assembly protein [Vibrio crassostreae]CAK3146396.1 Pilus assembly protein [Vibrio crassostreae]CAK3310063.1 Pilus assembly protein [Vibrio crassostreae]CAK3637077.1 Pilus assembly protein [Vibrio crassostreae]CAK3674381.1 Pilus assembly protein [Vibrio crassostreae]
MTVNKTHLKKQTGSAAVEFPFVVLAMMIILWGFVAIYRLFSLQTQLDNVTYNLVNAISSTQLKPEQGKNGLPETLKGPLLVLAESYLPSSIARGDIGLVLESRVFDVTTSSWPYTKPLDAGINCEGDQTIQQLESLIVNGSSDYPALDGRPSTLIQLTLCVETPFNYERLDLPKKLWSSSVVIGKHYG